MSMHSCTVVSFWGERGKGPGAGACVAHGVSFHLVHRGRCFDR